MARTYRYESDKKQGDKRTNFHLSRQAQKNELRNLAKSF